MCRSKAAALAIVISLNLKADHFRSANLLNALVLRSGEDWIFCLHRDFLARRMREQFNEHFRNAATFRGLWVR